LGCRKLPAVVLFDADGVVQTFEEGWLTQTATLSGSPEGSEDFVRELFAAEQPCLRGDGDFPAVIAQLLARWSSRHTVDEVLGMFRRIEPFPETLDLVGRLRASGIACHLASNQEPQRSTYMSRDLGYSELFDAEHYSWDIGAMKPEADYYERVGARIPHATSSLLFIDDRPENVTAARAAGWRAERYYYREGLDALKDLLARNGLQV
jgi:putative hydrolase of the HAD superfamily